MKKYDYMIQPNPKDFTSDQRLHELRNMHPCCKHPIGRCACGFNEPPPKTIHPVKHGGRNDD